MSTNSEPQPHEIVNISSTFNLVVSIPRDTLRHWLNRLPSDASITYYGNGTPPCLEARWKREL